VQAGSRDRIYKRARERALFFVGKEERELQRGEREREREREQKGIRAFEFVVSQSFFPPGREKGRKKRRGRRTRLSPFLVLSRLLRHSLSFFLYLTALSSFFAPPPARRLKKRGRGIKAGKGA
jgi:hypothetical protein